MDSTAFRFDLQTDICRILLDFWLAARKGALIPFRSGIDPAALKSILPWVSLISVSAPGVAEIRLAGTAYRDILGFETTGQNLIAITPPDARRVRAYRFHVSASMPCAGLATLHFDYQRGASDRFEFLTLPLEADAAGQPRTVICAISSFLGRRWRNERPGGIVDGPAEVFRFIDIGAGIPDRTVPPDDFLPGL